MGTLTQIEEYRKNGRVCLPVKAGTKRSEAKGWQTAREFHFDEGDGVAWRLDGITDLDLDSIEAIRLARSLLPRTACMCGREGAGASHLFYTGEAPQFTYKDPANAEGPPLLEVRSSAGRYTVVPPSVLPAKGDRPAGPAVWYADGPPTAADPAGLRRFADILAAATALARGLGTNGFGHAARLEVAGFLLRLGLTPAEVIDIGEALSAELNNTEVSDVAVTVKSTVARLAAGDSQVTGGPALAKRIGEHGKAIVAAVEGWLGKPKAAEKEPLRGWSELTDLHAFARRNAGRLRNNHRRGQWLLYPENGHSWEPQTHGEVSRLVHENIRELQKEASAIPDDELRRACLKWALAGESVKRMAALRKEAENVLPLADPGSGWDLDPWALACPNGVVDLRTGELRPGRPEELISMRARVDFDPDAKCPLWDKTLSEIFLGDQELIGYVDRFIGYSLTGDCREEALAVCWGEGANGKGTLMNTLAYVLGDHADDLPFSAFELQSRAGIPNDIAKIAGKRYVTSSETGDGVRLNEARVKALTGRDPITARFLHKEFFTFQPMAKFWLATNHKPEVTDDSAGFWRRIHLIPFLASFIGREDLTLKDRLRGEAAGILARAVRGCLEWQAVGLLPPESVKAGTKEWRRESDALAPFLESECVLLEGARCQANALYAAYVQWAKRVGIRDALSQRAVGLRMRKMFAVEEARHVHYLGVGLREQRHDEGM